MFKWPVRRVLIVVLAVLAAVGAAATIWKLLPRDTTTPAPAAADRPGVFVYDTTGFESVDAFGGARHEYPARTTISQRTTADGCTAFRWRPFRDRFWEWVTCGERLVRFAELHRFFGRMTAGPGCATKGRRCSRAGTARPAGRSRRRASRDPAC